MRLQEDLAALENWEKLWQMQFHPEKCQVICINNNKRFERQTEYKHHGHTLEVVDSGKYLWAHISNDLTWHTQADATADKASKTLGFLRRNLHECTKDVKKATYTALVRPILEYTSPARDPSSNEDTAKLEKVQRQAARFVHNNYYDRTPGWEPLQHRRRVDRLTTLYKIQRGLVEIDTDVVRPSDRRTRSHHRLPTRCHLVRLQELILPKDHPGMEPPTNAGHWCHHARGVPSQSTCRSCPADPPILNSRQLF